MYNVFLTSSQQEVDTGEFGAETNQNLNVAEKLQPLK